MRPVLWDYSSPICCYTLHVAHGDVVPVLVCGRVQRSGCAMRSKEKDVNKMQPKEAELGALFTSRARNELTEEIADRDQLILPSIDTRSRRDDLTKALQSVLK